MARRAHGIIRHSKSLLVEAATVRDTFQRYLRLGSVHFLKLELERDGIGQRLLAYPGPVGLPRREKSMRTP